MAAALAAARAGARVTVYERNDRLGKKILVTGNGRCNLGNEDLSAEDYHSGPLSLGAVSAGDEPAAAFGESQRDSATNDLMAETDQKRIAFWLKRFGTEETKAFFASLGLLVKSREGYLYPVCDQAAVVLDVLRFGLERAGVKVVSETKVERIERLREGGLRVCWTGGSASFDSVILSCGGRAAPRTGSDGNGYRLAGQLGLEQTPVVPALTGLRCREEYCKAIAGVRSEAEIRILENGSCLLRERGELQLVDYGISGIPVFQLSGQVNRLMQDPHALHTACSPQKSCASQKPYASQKSCATQKPYVSQKPNDLCGARVLSGSEALYGSKDSNALQGDGQLKAQIDFLPQIGEEAWAAYIEERLSRLVERGSQEKGGNPGDSVGGYTVETFFTGLLHKKLMTLFIKLAGLKPNLPLEDAPEEQLRKVFQLCRQFTLQISGSNSFDQAQVCSGGVKLSEVTEDLEAKKVPGLYLAGELLDVDGRCGGYNLQWAWTSGYIAGTAAAGSGRAMEKRPQRNDKEESTGEEARANEETTEKSSRSEN